MSPHTVLYRISIGLSHFMDLLGGEWPVLHRGGTENEKVISILLLLALMLPSTAVASWAEATASVDGISVVSQSNSDAEARAEITAPSIQRGSPTQRRSHYRRTQKIQQSVLPPPTTPSTAIVSTQSPTPAEPSTQADLESSSPEPTKPLEPNTLPQAVTQAVANEAEPPQVITQPASTSRSIEVLAFGSLGILGIDIILLLMILFHRPRPARNQPIEKRF